MISIPICKCPQLVCVVILYNTLEPRESSFFEADLAISSSSNLYRRISFIKRVLSLDGCLGHQWLRVILFSYDVFDKVYSDVVHRISCSYVWPKLLSVLRKRIVWNEIFLILIKHVLDFCRCMKWWGLKSIKVFNKRLVEDNYKVETFPYWKELSVFYPMRLLLFKKGTCADPWILQLVFVAI